jgi:hypothetical protein
MTAERRQESLLPADGLLLPALPAVEWMPLDELIQSWAAFAHASTSHAGLSAARAAFAALSAETAARQSSATAVSAASLPDTIYSELEEARQRWQEALDFLRCLPSCVQDDEAVPLVASLSALSQRHSLRLLAIYARLCYEAAEPAADDETACLLQPMPFDSLAPIREGAAAAKEQEEQEEEEERASW